MSRRKRHPPGAAEDAAPQPEERPEPEPPPAPGARLAALVAGAAAAVAVLVTVTFRINDPDVWQHLVVGKAIWQLHSVPLVHLWSWPTYGDPEVLPSWGFRALLWPFWKLGGVWGLYVWRWATTLAAFGILLVAARRMGARGLTPLLVIALAALSYRLRTQVRPETLVAVLLALQIWVLEARRSDPRRLHALLLVVIAWVWANVHISYYLGLLLIGFHALDALLEPRLRREREGEAPPQRGGREALALAGIGLAAAAVSFANPFGWRALWQPFEYFFLWRHEPIYRTIVELQPLVWSQHWMTGLPLLLLGWPLLIAWRARASGLDLAEVLTCGAFTALALSAERFVGFYALAATPYLARDLSAWVGSRAWPAWTASSFARGSLVSAACLLLGLVGATRAGPLLGIGFVMNQYPVEACNFMSAYGVRGRGFNSYYIGGYLLWEFWPDRDRLPFMDIHQSGTRAVRELYAFAFSDPDAWHELDLRFRYDYVVLDGHQEAVPGDRMLDFLDADSTWTLVFRDDAAALFVRPDGPLWQVAERFGYHLVPGGAERVPLLIRACQGDSMLRAATRAELQRQLAASPYNARAHSLLATLDWIDDDREASRAHLEAALETDPTALGIHQRLGMVALAEDRPEEAVRYFLEERALGYRPDGLDFLLGQAYQRSGDLSSARKWYQRELSVHPDHAAARESLSVIESRPGR